MRRYQVDIGNKSLDITVASDGGDYSVLIDGQKQHVALAELGDGDFHVLINNESHEVEFSKNSAEIKITVGGRSFHPVVYDYHLADALKSAGSGLSSKISRRLQAPMPGLVIRVDVVEGEAIVKGQSLVIVEAMKMENVIKAKGEGTIKTIYIRDGQSVEKGESLIDFD